MSLHKLDTQEVAAAQPAIITPDTRGRLIEALETPDQLEEMFKQAVEAQKAFQLLRNGQKVPDFSKILEVFSPEKRRAAQTFQGKKMILCTPGRSFNDMISAMDGHKSIMPGRVGTHVHPLFQKHADQEREHWGAHFIEDSESIGPTDKISDSLQGRCDTFLRVNQGGVIEGTDRWKYASLLMQSLLEGKPIDEEDRMMTILNDDPALVPEKSIPTASWYRDEDRACFFDLYAKKPNFDAYIRRSTGGIVQGS